MLDEQELWKKISKGDAGAFDTWYQETAPRLRTFLRHILGSQQAAEDVMQETFAQIWRHLYRFDAQRGSLRAYLYGVARKQAAEWERKQKPVEEIAFDPPTPNHIERATIIGEVFGHLTSDQRTILWLREVEGHSYQELAICLEIPVGTVRSRLFAAREALRALWRRKANLSGGSYALR